MAKGNAELKRKAIAIIDAGRRDIHAEADWLRHEMDVKRIAARFTVNHIAAVLGVAFGIGLLAPFLILGKRDHKKAHRHEPPRQPPPKEVKAPTAISYLVGQGLKFATPLLVKQGLDLLKAYARFPRG